MVVFVVALLSQAGQAADLQAGSYVKLGLVMLTYHSDAAL